MSSEPLSSKNPRVQQLRRLVRQRKIRDEAGLFVLEGAGLLAEALTCGAALQDVFIVAGAVLDAELADALGAGGTPIWELEPQILESVASTTSPQPVLATARQHDVALHEALSGAASFVVVAAGVREPGNAGTLIRTAAAAGADAVVFCDNPVDIFNPKAVRSSAGALFRVPVVVNAPLDTLRSQLSAAGLRTVGLAGGAATPYDRLDFTAPVAIVVGNEAHGLSDEARSIVDLETVIPMAAGVESVNVAAAVAAVCFEVRRQRSRNDPGTAR